MLFSFLAHRAAQESRPWQVLSGTPLFAGFSSFLYLVASMPHASCSLPDITCLLYHTYVTLRYRFFFTHTARDLSRLCRFFSFRYRYTLPCFHHPMSCTQQFHLSLALIHLTPILIFFFLLLFFLIFSFFSSRVSETPYGHRPTFSTSATSHCAMVLVQQAWDRLTTTEE